MIMVWSLLISCISIQLNGQEESRKKTVEYEVKTEKNAEGNSQNHVMKITSDGGTKVLTWDGEGEMPKEMQEQMKGDMALEDHDDARRNDRTYDGRSRRDRPGIVRAKPFFAH